MARNTKVSSRCSFFGEIPSSASLWPKSGEPNALLEIRRACRRLCVVANASWPREWPARAEFSPLPYAIRAAALTAGCGELRDELSQAGRAFRVTEGRCRAEAQRARRPGR